MKILVCGGRDFGRVHPQNENSLEQYKFIMDVLGRLMIKYSKEYNPKDNWLPTDITIISGGASGADSAAIDFAISNFTKLEVYEAAWKTHGKAAGAIRNQQMLDEGKPDLVVAFPGGNGTADMVRRARNKGIEVKEITFEPI